MFVRAAAEAQAATTTRLIAAASELFAERGFHGTKVRDIAERAGVNVAAGHYHYGSKKDLYLEVLREQFARIRRQIEASGTEIEAGGLARLTKGALRRLLRVRLQIMLDTMVGQTSHTHAQLMMREMADPSEALPVIVREFITPLVEETRQIVAHLFPELDRSQVERVTFSMAAQVHFYRTMRPVVLSLKGMRAYSPSFLDEVVDHVFEFSLGGMDRLTKKRRGRA